MERDEIACRIHLPAPSISSRTRDLSGPSTLQCVPLVEELLKIWTIRERSGRAHQKQGQDKSMVGHESVLVTVWSTSVLSLHARREV